MKSTLQRTPTLKQTYTLTLLALAAVLLASLAACSDDGPTPPSTHLDAGWKDVWTWPDTVGDLPDCAATSGCPQYGACHWSVALDKCAPTTFEDCQQSEACTNGGRCKLCLKKGKCLSDQASMSGCT